MCTLDDIQNELGELADKLDRYHADHETRITAIEENYLTRADIEQAIDKAVMLPLQEINETLKQIQQDLKPWKRRQQMWSFTTMLSQDAGGILVWIGQISVGILALYGLGVFLGWW